MLIFAALISCIPTDVKAIRQDDQERDMLADAARVYWEGVRWEVPERASRFIETEDDRALFTSRLDGLWAAERLIEVTVLKVTVEEAAPAADADTWRTGTVLLKLEGYTLPAQIVRNEEYSQSWYRTPGGWWVDWDPEAPGPLTGSEE